MRYSKLLPRKRRIKDVHRIGLHGAVGMLVRKGNKVVRVCAECNKIIDEKRRVKENGDLLSNCCAWDFNPFGYNKEEGIWQERCLKCNKLCEPIWIGSNDIENIRSCYFWNKLNEPNL